MRLGTIRDPSHPNTLRLAVFTNDDRVLDVRHALDAVRSHADIAYHHTSTLDGAPYTHAWLTREGVKFIRHLAATAPPSLHRPLGTVRLGPPVPRPGKFVAAGRNYMDHLREGQRIWKERGKVVQRASFPTAFAKFASSIVATDEPIVLPAGMTDVDYEIELAVVIGAPALCVPERDALSYVAGYTICNDVAARRIQRAEMEHQIGIMLAKNFPSFAPLGPWLVTADEIADPQALDLTLRVNGEVRQRASTAEMIFPVSQLVAYWSQLGLEPGDVISTGTPAGVALARPDPERFYLKNGDRVEATIDRIGTLYNPVLASEARE